MQKPRSNLSTPNGISWKWLGPALFGILVTIALGGVSFLWGQIAEADQRIDAMEKSQAVLQVNQEYMIEEIGEVKLLVQGLVAHPVMLQ